MTVVASNRCERGTALLEFPLILPVLFLLLSSVFEVGRAIVQYQILSQIVYEGVGHGIHLNGMAPGCYDNKYKESTVGNSIDPHRMAQTRVFNLYNRYVAAGHVNLGDTDNILIQSKFITGTEPEDLSYYSACEDPNPDDTEQNTFTLHVEGNYTPLIFSFLSFPMSVQITGPYLFDNNQYIIPNTGLPPKEVRDILEQINNENHNTNL